jgi:hypothetical protein
VVKKCLFSILTSSTGRTPICYAGNLWVNQGIKMISTEHVAFASASQRSCFKEIPYATMGHGFAGVGLQGIREAIDFADIDAVSVVTAR